MWCHGHDLTPAAYNNISNILQKQHIYFVCLLKKLQEEYLT